jgi:hypothetical protein
MKVKATVKYGQPFKFEIRIFYLSGIGTRAKSSYHTRKYEDHFRRSRKILLILLIFPTLLCVPTFL